MTTDPLTPVYSSPDQFAPTMKQAYDEGKDILINPENGLYYATSKYISKLPSTPSDVIRTLKTFGPVCIVY